MMQSMKEGAWASVLFPGVQLLPHLDVMTNTEAPSPLGFLWFPWRIYYIGMIC